MTHELSFYIYLFVFGTLPILDGVDTGIQVVDELRFCHVTRPQNHVLQFSSVSSLEPGESFLLKLTPQLHETLFVSWDPEREGEGRCYTSYS